MKKSILGGAVVLMLVLMPLVAGASLMQWEDAWTPDNGPVYFSGQNRSFSFALDIKNDDFVVGADEVNRYSLTISLRDDAHHDGWELAFIDLPGFRTDALVDDMADITLGDSFKGLFSLNTSGTLDVTIYRLWGDFELLGSSLVAFGEGASSVPLPASVLFMASGLVGLTGYRRRIKKQGLA
jgi:hypothetical protein